jgi:hypothetical protein
MWEIQILRLLTTVRHAIARACIVAPVAITLAITSMVLFHIWQPKSLLRVLDPLILIIGNALETAANVLPSAQAIRMLPDAVAGPLALVTWLPWHVVAFTNVIMRMIRFLVTSAAVPTAILAIGLTALAIRSIRTALQHYTNKWKQTGFAVEHVVYNAYLTRTIKRETKLVDPLVDIVLRYSIET